MINQKGQSLIEAVVALGAAVLIISAIAVVVITAVNNADFSKYQNLATQYSQQGMEILKQQSQSDWQGFSVNYPSGTYCLNQSSTTLTNLFGTICPKNINNFFVRQVVINQGSVGCNSNTKVSVSVYWADGKCPVNTYCHDVTLDSCLANINNAPAP